MKTENENLTFEKFKGAGATLGTVVGGMVVGHVALKALKKEESTMICLGAAGASIVISNFIENPYLKLAVISLGAYAAIRGLNNVVKEAVQPGTAGLGFLPESVKSSIRKFLPTISGLGSTEDNALLGEALRELNLASVVDGPTVETVDVPYTDVTGLGNAALLV